MADTASSTQDTDLQQPVDDIPENFSWWTPGGWIRQPAPAVFQIIDAIKPGTSSDSAFEAEYTSIYAGEEGWSDYAATVHRAKDGHLRVITGNWNMQPIGFFVSAEDAAAFMVEKLPAMAMAEAASAPRKNLLKAFAAFVRHGHGKHVLDEEGETTVEEDQRYREERAARRRERT